jgi:thioester reductase-like protein
VTTRLVTGYPRLLARRIATEVLADPDARVVMLVRTRFLEEAHRWARTLGDDAARVEVLEGEVTAIDLGLAGREYLDLARRIDVVHHAAYSTSLEVGAEAITALNLQGTREVIELARVGKEQGSAPRVVAYSSVLALGGAEGLLREDELDLGQRLRSPAEATMHGAEKLLRQAMTTLPVTVLRASMLVGDSQTGEMDLFDGPYLFIMLMLSSPVDLRLPLPAGGDLPLHIVPVDHVARAGVRLGVMPDTVGRTFHIVDPSPPSTRYAFERIAQVAGRRVPRGMVPVNLSRALLNTPGLERLTRSPRAFVDRLATRARYANAGTAALLAAQGVECPPFEAYVGPLVAYAQARLDARRHRAVEVDVDDPLA